MMVHPAITYRNLIESHRYREAAWLAAKTAAASAGAESALWFCRQAAADLRDNRNENALEAAATACALTPQDPRALLLKAETLLLLDKADEAYDDFRTALHYGADRGTACRGSIDCLIKCSRFDEALAAAESNDLPPEIRFFYTIRILAGLGRFGDALALCENPPTPADPAAIAWLRCTLELKRDGAEAVLRRYREREVPVGKRKIHRELCRYCERRNEIPADGKESKRFLQSMKKKALTLAKTGDTVQALTLLEDLLLSDPAAPYLNNTYVAASRRTGFLHAALEFYGRLSRLFPEERLVRQRITRLETEKRGMSEKY